MQSTWDEPYSRKRATGMVNSTKSPYVLVIARGLFLMKSHRSWKLFVVAFLSASVLPAIFALRYHALAVVCTFAGDADYYLAITRASRGFHGFTFDGVYQMNGFHPLWEYILSFFAWTGALSFRSPASALLFTYWLNLLVLSLAAGFFVVASSRYLKNQWLALLVACPGFVWFVVALVTPQYLSTWSFVNGMEGALSWLCFSLALLVYQQGNEEGTSLTCALLFSMLAGLGVLARLDEVFVVVALGGLLLVEMLRAPGTGKRVESVALFLPATLMLLSYMIYNRIEVGAFLPLSGSMKAGFAFFATMKMGLRYVLPVVTGDAPAAVLKQGLPGFYNETYARLLQLILPALICGAGLVWSLKRNTTNQERIFRALCAGAVIKAAYNLCFVTLFNQGVWYFTLSIAVANLVVIRWLDDVLFCAGIHSPQPLFRQILCGFSYFLMVLATYGIYITRAKSESSPQRWAILQDGAAVRAEFQAALVGRFIEYDDAGISYSTDIPGVSAFGLALDLEGVRALKSGNFLALMDRRGIHTAAAFGGYAQFIDAAISARAWEKGETVFFLRPEEFKQYRLERFLVDEVHGVEMYQVVPIREAAK